MKNLVKVTARKSPSDSIVFYAYEGDDYAKDVSFGYVIKSVESASYEHASLAQEVVAHLPGVWSIEPTDRRHDCNFRLIRADGLRLWFSPIGRYDRPGKGYVSYDRLRDRKNGWIYAYDADHKEILDPSIKYALTKSPEQVAKEIARRLLPDAEALHAQVVERLAGANAFADACDTATATAKALRGTHGVYFDASGSSIQVRGYVSPEIARKLTEFLSTIPESKCP